MRSNQAARMQKIHTRTADTGAGTFARESPRRYGPRNNQDHHGYTTTSPASISVAALVLRRRMMSHGASKCVDNIYKAQNGSIAHSAGRAPCPLGCNAFVDSSIHIV